MKVIAVFAAILAVACANNSWTVQQLSDAIADPHTDAALKPFLIAALDSMMDNLWAGHQVEAVTVTIPSPGGPTMTLEQISEALQNPDTDPALVPALEAALNQMMENLFAGIEVSPAVVAAPAMEIHYYTLHELSVALQSESTNPQLVPFLEHALNAMLEATFAGEPMSVFVIAVPAGLNPIETPVVVLPPVEGEIIPVMPVIPDVPLVPDVSMLPEIHDTPAAPVSPLVQIIVNVN